MATTVKALGSLIFAWVMSVVFLNIGSAFKLGVRSKPYSFSICPMWTMCSTHIRCLHYPVN